MKEISQSQTRLPKTLTATTQKEHRKIKATQTVLFNGRRATT
jgi:hypothetical protein